MEDKRRSREREDQVSDEKQLAVIEGSIRHEGAATHHRAATDAAGLCGEIVKRTAKQIQGRKYVQVEGWQSIANAFGCFAAARDVERVQGGFRAVGEVRRVVDGAVLVLSTAEGFVGDDEKTWAGRHEYAKRAMAQTRAISRACRSAFAFVVTLIDGDLSTTPAEEVPEGGFDAATGEVKPAQRTAASRPTVPPPTPGARNLPTVFPNFGRSKGGLIAGATQQDLAFYRSSAMKSLNDASKSRFHEAERALIEAIDLELSRQANNEPPPPSDDDGPPF